MPIRAYVWKETDDNYGHASLELSDGTYISWWPGQFQNKTDPVFGSTPPDTNVSLTDDIRSEKAQPTHTFILPDELGLNETKMKRWWEEMKKEGKWNLLFNNCCNAVKKALNAGGLLVERQIIETPAGMVDFFNYLVELHVYAGPRKKKTYN